jgi:hypothetical protein
LGILRESGGTDGWFGNRKRRRRRKASWDVDMSKVYCLNLSSLNNQLLHAARGRMMHNKQLQPNSNKLGNCKEVWKMK